MKDYSFHIILDVRACVHLFSFESGLVAISAVLAWKLRFAGALQRRPKQASALLAYRGLRNLGFLSEESCAETGEADFISLNMVDTVDTGLVCVN